MDIGKGKERKKRCEGDIKKVNLFWVSLWPF